MISANPARKYCRAFTPSSWQVNERGSALCALSLRTRELLMQGIRRILCCLVTSGSCTSHGTYDVGRCGGGLSSIKRPHLRGGEVRRPDNREDAGGHLSALWGVEAAGGLDQRKEVSGD